MPTLLAWCVFVISVIAGAVVRRSSARQLLWLVASYTYYATFGATFLFVLLTSSLFNFFYGGFLRRNPTAARLWGGIAANAGLLIFYKVAPALASLGGKSSMSSELLSGVVMPLGVSFWTFQAMSYLFDVYRQEEVDPSWLEFCLYMAFWPTVLMGPICRLGNMLPQFRSGERSSANDLLIGTRRIVTGLFMKVVLSQLLVAGVTSGAGVAAGFDGKLSLSGLDVWFLAIGFGFQLFFDFAGYSHMVIGAARLFGYRLDENFDSPFLALTPSEFWTRWHMSLSSWIRDYVFLPVASARREVAWRYFALLFSMTLFGLWHGVTFLFFLWGFYHGALLVAHRLIQQQRRKMSFVLPGSVDAFLAWAVSFPAVSLGWVFFRAGNVQQAITMLKAVVSPGTYLSPALSLNYYLMVLTALASFVGYRAIAGAFGRIRSTFTPEFRTGLTHWGLTKDFASFVSLIPTLAILFLGMLIVYSKSDGVTQFVYAVF